MSDTIDKIGKDVRQKLTVIKATSEVPKLLDLICDSLAKRNDAIIELNRHTKDIEYLYAEVKHCEEIIKKGGN